MFLSYLGVFPRFSLGASFKTHDPITVIRYIIQGVPLVVEQRGMPNRIHIEDKHLIFFVLSRIVLKFGFFKDVINVFKI